MPGQVSELFAQILHQIFRLFKPDLTISWKYNQTWKETWISGSGQIHLNLKLKIHMRFIAGFSTIIYNHFPWPDLDPFLGLLHDDLFRVNPRHHIVFFVCFGFGELLKLWVSFPFDWKIGRFQWDYKASSRKPFISKDTTITRLGLGSASSASEVQNLAQVR